MENKPKKSLGQHWLNDSASLHSMLEAAEVAKEDIVLEIGPGQGSLTRLLAEKAGRVVAVEFDEKLAASLPNSLPSDNLQVITSDIRKFDLTTMLADYKIVANIPYYLTANLIRILTETGNKPAIAALLVQKEVAQRLAAVPGKMSQVAAIAQLFYEVSQGPVVEARLFTPPPKVDSQIVVLKNRPGPLFENTDQNELIKFIKLGFSSPRKTLLNNLSVGLRQDKDKVLEAIKQATLPTARAQELSLEQWKILYELLK